MKFMVVVLIVLVILLVSGVLLLRKYYIDWCKSFKDKRKSRDLKDKMEFLVKFIAVVFLLIVLVATMIFDCIQMVR